MSSDQHRVIGFWRGWSIAVGCAIGSGIYMMPTMLAPYGLLGFGGWVVAGAGSILVALTMARLVKRIPKTGGPYVYVNEGLGKFSGFIIAWTYWVACVSAISGISIAFVGYLGFFIPQIANSQISALLASLPLLQLRQRGLPRPLGPRRGSCGRCPQCPPPSDRLATRPRFGTAS